MKQTNRALSSYALRLFMVQYNLIVLGGAVLFSLAAASPLPLAIGATTELVVLVVGSSLPGVRRWLDRRDSALRRTEADNAVRRAIQGLDREYAGRLLALQRALDEIRDFGGRRPEPNFERAMLLLATLGPVFLGLCESHQRISRFLRATPGMSLAGEIERLSATFAAEKDLGLRLALRQAIGQAQRRLEHCERMTQLLRSIGVKLDAVECSIAYLRAQGSALADNPGLLSEVETLLAEIGPAVPVEVEPGDLDKLTPPLRLAAQRD